MVDTRVANLETQLDTDQAILDFLTYDALNAVIANGANELLTSKKSVTERRVTRHLNMVDCKSFHKNISSPREYVSQNIRLIALAAFLTMFKAIHSETDCGAELRLRLQLLRFAVMFTRRRIVSDSKIWRKEIKRLRWRRRKDIHQAQNDGIFKDIPDLVQYLTSDPMEIMTSRAPKDSIESYHSRNSKHDAVSKPNRTLASPPGKADNSPPPDLSLLDILPFFLSLSAISMSQSTFAPGSVITPAWMRLAAGFMAQAVIEQYLVYDDSHRHREREGDHSEGKQTPPPTLSPLEEAFTWGFDPEATYEEGTEGFLINAMFFDDTAAEGEGGEAVEWEEIKREHIDCVSTSYLLIHLHFYVVQALLGKQHGLKWI